MRQLSESDQFRVLKFTAELVRRENDLRIQRLARVQQISDDDETDDGFDAANVLNG